MNTSQLINTRLATQQIAATKCTTVSELVHWMGAMQAQDYPMAKWAIGARLHNITENEVDAAIDKGDIIRTHILRPTWHLVAATDIHWILALTAPNIMVAARTRHKLLELTAPMFRKAAKIIEKTLQGNNHLTRDELMLHFQKARINVSEERAAHFMMQAELDGLVCSGKIQSKKHTYALLEERIGPKKKFDKNEALAMLAQKYFQSHGPATLQDFEWWSGLSIKDSRMALEMAKQGLFHETIGEHTYWFDNLITFQKAYKKSLFTLPAFDEYTVSYRHRGAVLPADQQQLAISSNGIFRPIIIMNGKVVGLWSRTFSKNKVMVTADFFDDPSRPLQKLAEKSFKKFGDFLGKEIEVKFNK